MSFEQDTANVYHADAWHILRNHDFFKYVKNAGGIRLALVPEGVAVRPLDSDFNFGSGPTVRTALDSALANTLAWIKEQKRQGLFGHGATQ